jgi:hypothetical protein
MHGVAAVKALPSAGYNALNPLNYQRAFCGGPHPHDFFDSRLSAHALMLDKTGK